VGGDEVVVRAPGRVNLIGDHTDYNDGFVLPLAIELATVVRARARTDRRVVATSAELGPAEADLDRPQRSGSWLDYVVGAAVAYEALHPGTRLVGMEATVTSDVPVGAGLSSSAALELGALRALVALAGHRWDPVAAAQAAQRGENDWVGARVGIMDQLVVAAARPGAALLIDCRTLDVTPHPLPGGAAVAVLDTGTRRRLVGSAYNQRRAQCRAAAAQLGVAALRDATAGDLARIADPAARRRARHVVTENQRVLEAAAALDRGDIATVGRLMVASHRSLAGDYEVSAPPLDAMVDAALASPGCLGARLTGAGFAGCAVALVERDRAGPFAAEVTERYRRSGHGQPAVHLTAAAGGVEVLAGRAPLA
jgi:galactokinase